MGKTTYHIQETTIASGTTTDMIQLDGKTLVGVIIPASVSSVNMKILNAIDPSDTPVAIYDGDGIFGLVGDYNPTIAASKSIIIPPSVSASLINIKLEFDASETTKTYKLITREIE